MLSGLKLRHSDARDYSRASLCNIKGILHSSFTHIFWPSLISSFINKPKKTFISYASFYVYFTHNIGTLLIDCIAAGKLLSKTYFLIWIDSVWWLASDHWSKSRVDWYQDLYMTAFLRSYSKSISDDDVAMSANFLFQIFYFFW